MMYDVSIFLFLCQSKKVTGDRFMSLQIYIKSIAYDVGYVHFAIQSVYDYILFIVYRISRDR